MYINSLQYTERCTYTRRNY